MTPPERTLLTCLAGGGVFAPEFASIGVASGLVRRAVADARSRGYECVEGNPHDPGIGRLLERCGFQRIARSGAGSSPLPDIAFCRLVLA
jgi:hypothetical protein